MSSTVINTNVMSLNSQHNLRKSDNSLAQSLQRLSSGLRINSAKDDAAGLAISDRMTAMIKGNAQSIRNANDGISMVQTAEGALSTISNDLQRMRELAVQSANDSNTALDRVTLDNEFQQLIRAIGRVANTTDFNTRKLLDGTLQSQVFQTGANQGNTIATTSVDARNTQLGSRQILGNEGVTEAQLKNGVQEIKGSFTVSISEVRGQSIVPIELEIDLSDPVFNPDVNAEGTKAGTTGLTTLEDVTRVVNNAIQRAISGTESAGTFSYDTGSMDSEDARLKLAQANVSAAIVTRNNGESTLILRGAFDSQFELKINESVNVMLKAGENVGEVDVFQGQPMTGTNNPTTAATIDGIAGTPFDVGTTFDFKLDGVSVPQITIGSVGVNTLADFINYMNLNAGQPGGLPEGIVLSEDPAGTLVITDTLGRTISDVVLEDSGSNTIGNLASITASTTDITGFSDAFDETAITAGQLQTLTFTLGGTDISVDLSTATSLNGGAPDINSLLAVADPDLSATFANNTLTITDALGRSITNVNLVTDETVDGPVGASSVVTLSDLTAAFNDGVNGNQNISGFAITIDGERINADLTGVTNQAELRTAIETAIKAYGEATPGAGGPFSDVIVDFDPAGDIRIRDPQGRVVDGVSLTGPQSVNLFNRTDYDNSVNNDTVDNPYKSEQVNLTQINVTTRYDSMLALNIIDGALNQISDLRSELGAVQKLFESAVDNLGTYNVNLSAARSRILDTDFAAETAALTRAQILQQAGISTLSQANAGPQAILSLLQ